MPKFAHVVLTRFNVEPVPGDRKAVFSAKWIDTRLALMKRYAAASIGLQSDGGDWYCLIHPETRNFSPRAADYIKAMGAQVVVTDTPTVTSGELVGQLYGGKPLILTRLDSDDAIAEDYLEKVAEAATEAVRVRSTLALRFLHGIELAVGRRTARSLRSAAPPVVSLAALNGVDLRHAVDRLYHADRGLDESITIPSKSPKWVWSRHKFQTGGLPEPAGDWDKLEEYRRFFGFEL